MTVSAIEYQLRSSEATWTYARWEQLPDDGNRYEVIDGVLYMTTAPNNRHQFIVTRLVLQVGAPLEAAGVAMFAIAPIGVIMPGCDPVQPDFLVIRAERAHSITADERIRIVPDLIAEVLSPSNPEHDLLTKRAAYARAGVPEYWIVRPDTRDVLLLSDPDPAAADFGTAATAAYGADLVSPTLPIRVAVAALFDLPPVLRQPAEPTA
ncbi:MAG: Uma2 family endonuclease [Chloroflexi bacterium]|nr:MAG: Uma2 family endonuclease [Chloroflexota bacterium]